MKAVLASKNAHKLQEIAQIVEKFGLELVLQSELGIDIDVEETGTTFEENSMLKAQVVMEASGMIAIADDSGLMVDALDGGPGVARQTKRRLEAAGLLREGEGELIIENSLPGDSMIRLSRQLLGQ